MKGNSKAVEEKYPSLIEVNIKEKENLEKEKNGIIEKCKKELVDLMKKMAQAEAAAEERHRVLTNTIEQKKKELKEKHEKDGKESIERSEKEKENLMGEMAKAKEKAERRYQEERDQGEQEAKEQKKDIKKKGVKRSRIKKILRKS